ncbi:bifunctional adenosylcobinamide kinase/adenosylcobinamide-phosphate guanylyltransferase [Roseibium litorale]|uniref:Bifunctional adenosylcobalamin biosynthesis protein n=1 Tax=Roseibium litorale TaxID=2803841 RepID=A0ABR9CT53_9HYPH|nr:bifunctional adenosylcobinamide kinase/adenosylcobinamide-phosphate guanylyltransferase [Roseibium litorale]MBD8894053.1 bifunctional adenosylcobinamide kinase/adenosylcobinamide-phosphate guanylyltransferase [Roseibium litorale]
MTDPLKRAAPPRTVLVLGGARSGKSRFAESLALNSGLSRLYVATSPLIDAETRDRVALHKAQRGAGWRTVEEETDVAGVLECEAGPGRVILVDCLTLWLNNLFFKELDVEAETERLCRTVRHLKGPVIFVSNEIGLGLVPETKLSRDFRDAQGRINQAMADVCQSVVFVAAGLPLTMKPSNQPDVTL